jgi:hypothetical protein
VLCEQPLGRLPTCFAREFGGAIPDYVILRDPCHNEFEVCVVRESGVVYFGDGWLSLKEAPCFIGLVQFSLEFRLFFLIFKRA